MMLYDLAQEYLRGAELLRQRIGMLNTEEKNGGLCDMELMRLRIRRDTLRAMYYEAKRTAKYLENYYR
jgi:hypothetical protein